MPRIRRIQIRNFRSIKNLDIEVNDLAIFVGDNDSGKSNILRAINLFFNQEVEPGIPLDFTRDYNRFTTDNRRAAQIDISLTFELPDGYRENNGERVIWKKSWRNTGLIEGRDWSGLKLEKNRLGNTKWRAVEITKRSKVPALLSRIEFEYIPAIRGADFFKKLRGRIYRVISDVSEKSFRESSSDFEVAIGKNVTDLIDDISREISDTASLKLPNDLSHIFESLDFLNGDKSISLDHRGDGIKGRYVPLILKFIADKKSSLLERGGTPYTFIWAYEEPENNLEMRRAQEIDMFRRFWDWAEKHGHATEKLFEGMKVAKAKQTAEKRKAYTKDQFGLLYTELTTNRSGLVKKDDHKWGTLLAMFTGARLREVAQLMPSDIRSEDGIWYIDINADDEKKSLKSPAAKRRVPIHSELIRLGLLEWVKSCSKQPRLFMSFSYNTKEGYGRNLGRWFGTFLTKIGMKEDSLVFHSLRHTAITRMRQASVELPLVQEIVGHERDAVTDGYFGEGYTLAQKKEAIQKLRV